MASPAGLEPATHSLGNLFLVICKQLNGQEMLSAGSVNLAKLRHFGAYSALFGIPS
jgi:hypothetical protein